GTRPTNANPPAAASSPDLGRPLQAAPSRGASRRAKRDNKQNGDATDKRESARSGLLTRLGRPLQAAPSRGASRRAKRDNKQNGDATDKRESARSGLLTRLGRSLRADSLSGSVPSGIRSHSDKARGYPGDVNSGTYDTGGSRKA